MPRNIDDLIEDMRDAAERASRHVNGLNREQFTQDEKTVDAVVRCLTILGEAAKQVPQTDRDRLPSVPWRQITGLRDRVVHDYLGIDLGIVWEVAQVFLPELLATLPKSSDNNEP